MTGAKTNIVTTMVIDTAMAADSPQFKTLLENTTANGFRIQDLCANKAYLSRENLELAQKLGAVAYIQFKSNSVVGEAGTLREKMFGFFQFPRAEFLAKYHQRNS
jgi:hypothetical protein